MSARQLPEHLDLAQAVDAFLEASVDGQTARAVGLLTDRPAIATFDVSTAAMLGEASHVGGVLDRDPALAVRSDHRRGWPPLRYVCHSDWHRIDPGRAAGMLAVARLLLDAGANPNTSSRGESVHGHGSPLHDAVTVNNPALTRLLLERGANPNDGESLYHAVFHSDHECLRVLIEHGATVNGTNALPALIGRGDVEGVRIFLDAGADPGRPHPPGSAPAGHLPDMTNDPLALAAQKDSAAVVEALLVAGADPDARCRDGRSALRAAVRRGRTDVAELLLRHGARNDVEEIDRFLGACSRADRAEADELLARHPGLVDRLSEEDRAVIVDTAEIGSPAAVRLMVDLGFPIDVQRGMDGATALHASAYGGRTDVVRLLIAGGADLERRDLQWHSTPLCWATVGSGERPGVEPDADWVATVQTLLDAGASAGDALVESKPPSDEVAALLVSYGVGGDDTEPLEAQDDSTADPALLGQIAECLRAAFESDDLELLGSVLHRDVRWGGGPGGCWNRDQVLEWYSVLRDRSGPARVTEVVVRDGAVVIGLRAAGAKGELFQVFRVTGDSIVTIEGYQDLREALARTTG
jgi:ankyrin repeat protein